MELWAMKTLTKTTTQYSIYQRNMEAISKPSDIK